MLLSPPAYSYVINCRWVGQIDYEPGFFRPAGFNLVVGERRVDIEDEGYFSRHYSPCYDGVRDSCTYDFEIDTDLGMRLHSSSEKSLILEQINNYDKAQLNMIFSSPLPGRIAAIMTMKLYGYGGNVGWVDGDEFYCKHVIR